MVAANKSEFVVPLVPKSGHYFCMEARKKTHSSNYRKQSWLREFLKSPEYKNLLVDDMPIHPREVSIIVTAFWVSVWSKVEQRLMVKIPYIGRIYLITKIINKELRYSFAWEKKPHNFVVMKMSNHYLNTYIR